MRHRSFRNPETVPGKDENAPGNGNSPSGGRKPSRKRQHLAGYRELSKRRVIRPFTIPVAAEEGVKDLRARVAATRWPVRLAGVGYDAELADRIRYLIGTGPGVSEKKMFGGLAFLIGGNMAISASGNGGALVRVDPAESAALAGTTATVAVMRGREMAGWLRVSSDDLEADDQLAEWVSRAVRYARSLPSKR